MASQSYSGTIAVNGDQTSGSNTIAVSGTGGTTTPPPPTGPRTQFGAGQWRVGTDIAAGRYFSAARNGCYWERQKGLSGSTSDIIANDFLSFNTAQYIVDILSSDLAFQTDAECGTWFNSPRTGAQATIPPGIWLVGSQITPGTYRVDARSGCYWERLRNFEGVISSIIDNEFVSSAGQQLVTISSSDVGFNNDAECGTWTRTTTLSSTSVTGHSHDIRANRDRTRARWAR